MKNRKILSAATCLSACLSIAILSGCANLQSATVSEDTKNTKSQSIHQAFSPPNISIGSWENIGSYLAPWLAGDSHIPVSGDDAITDIFALKNDAGKYNAIFIMQSAGAGNTAACAIPSSIPSDLQIPHSSNSLNLAKPLESACLRMKGAADFEKWLQKQHSNLYNLLEQEGFSFTPRTWIAHRVPSANGGTLEVHAVLSPEFLEQQTRDNASFLVAGVPATSWAMKFANAVENAAQSSPQTRTLQIPAFPFAPTFVKVLAKKEQISEIQQVQQPETKSEIKNEIPQKRVLKPKRDRN